MIQRLLQDALLQVAGQYPVVCLLGPRQSGKSTLTRMAFPDKPYVTCKDASTFMLAQDPVAFFRQVPSGAVIDEIQRVPSLVEHLMTVVDAQAAPGRWILTGSENLGVRRTVAESLAGRVALLHLLPFSHAELSASERRPRTLAEAILHGGYPPLYDPTRTLEPWRWHANYLDTYVQNDVLSMLRIHDRTAFRRFLQLCARHVGCLTNAQQWGAEIGKDSKTIAGWLAVLEANFVLRLLPTSGVTLGKRMVKHPKLYFYDTGLVCRLLGLTEVHQVTGHPQWGNLVENWCMMEVQKARWHRGLDDGLSHWRSSDGHEVDLLLQAGGQLHPIEIKAHQTADPSLAGGLHWWRAAAVAKAQQAIGTPMVIYGGERTVDLAQVRLVPWHGIDSALAWLGP